MKSNFSSVVVLAVAFQLLGGQGRADDGRSTKASAGEDQTNDLAAWPDSLVSRKDWARRIQQARARAEEARREGRLGAALRVFKPDPPEKIASERVVADDTLQPGDIVSTDRGFLLFRGRSGADGQRGDFVPLAPR